MYARVRRSQNRSAASLRPDPGLGEATPIKSRSNPDEPNCRLGKSIACEQNWLRSAISCLHLLRAARARAAPTKSSATSRSEGCCRLAAHPAAVDHQDLAVDVVGGGGGEEDGCAFEDVWKSLRCVESNPARTNLVADATKYRWSSARDPPAWRRRRPGCFPIEARGWSGGYTIHPRPDRQGGLALTIPLLEPMGFVDVASVSRQRSHHRSGTAAPQGQARCAVSKKKISLRKPGLSPGFRTFQRAQTRGQPGGDPKQ